MYLCEYTHEDELKCLYDDVISVGDDFWTNGIEALQHWREKFENCKGNDVLK